MNPTQYQALRTELDAGHPVSGPYNVDDKLAADQIMELNINASRDTVSISEIFTAITNNKDEWDALPDDATRQWVRDILDFNRGGVPTIIGAPARTQLVAILGAATKAELAAVISITISRATELGFGLVHLGDIQNARVL